MPVIYCTSVSQSYRRILRHARNVILEKGSGQARLRTIPPRLNPREQVEWAQRHIVGSPEWVGPGWLVVASTFELPILRVMRVLRDRLGDTVVGAHDVSDQFSVHVLADPVKFKAAGLTRGLAVFSLRVEERGEFLDPWPEGFFEERMGELF